LKQTKAINTTQIGIFKAQLDAPIAKI